MRLHHVSPTPARRAPRTHRLAAAAPALRQLAPVALAAALLCTPMAPFAQIEMQEARLVILRQSQIITNTAAAIVAARAADTDNDGMLEPPAMVAGTGPAGGGLLPAGMGSAVTDSFGTALGYCAWDHGTTNASANRIGGMAAGAGVMLAVVSAGPDRTFNTSCEQIAAGVTAGDDYVAVRDLNQTALTAGVSLARPAVANQAALNNLVAARNTQLATNPGQLDPLVPGELRLTTSDNALWRFDPAAGGGGAFVRVTAAATSGSDINTGGGNIDTGGGNINTGGGSINTGGGSINTGTGGLTVGGATNLAGTTINGPFTVTGVINLNSTGNAGTFIGNPQSTTTINGPLQVNAATTITGLLYAQGGIDTKGAAITTGAGNLTVGGLTSLGTTTINGNTTIDGTLGVTGASAFSGLAEFNAGIAVKSGAPGNVALLVTGVNGQTADLLQVKDSSGNVLFRVGPNGNTTIAGLLQANGGINTGAGALTVGGASSLKNTTIGGTLGVTGTTNINTTGTAGTTIGNPNSTTTIGGPLVANGTGSISGLLSANGGITTNGAAISTVGGTLNTGSGNILTGGGTLNTGSGSILTGGGVINTGSGNIVTAGGSVSTNGGVINTGGGNFSTGGGHINSGDGNLTVGGTSNLKNTTIGGTLGVTGTTNINTTGTAGTTIGNPNSTTTIGGPLVVNGAFDIGTGNLTVGGSTNLANTKVSGTLEVTGASSFGGLATFNDGISVRSGSAGRTTILATAFASQSVPLLELRNSSNEMVFRVSPNGNTVISGSLAANGGLMTNGAAISTSGGVINTGSGNIVTGGGSVSTNGGVINTGGGNFSTGGGNINSGDGNLTVGGTSNLIGATTFGSATEFAALTLNGPSGSVPYLRTTNNLPLSINTGGAARIYIQSDGDVGIGTTNPAFKLDVAGTFRATGLATLSGGATITGTTNINTTGSAATNIGSVNSITNIGGALQLGSMITSAGDQVAMLNSPTLPLSLRTNGTERILLHPDGYIEIDSASKSNLYSTAGKEMDYAGDVAIRGAYNSNTNDTAALGSFGGDVRIKGGATMGRLVGSQGGNVILIAGAAYMDAAPSAARGGDIQIFAGEGSTDAARGQVMIGIGGGDYYQPGRQKIEVIRINPFGNVGIGTDSPDRKLDLLGDFRAAGNVQVGSNSTLGSMLITGPTGSTAVLDTGNALPLSLRVNGVERISMFDTGEIKIGGGVKSQLSTPNVDDWNGTVHIRGLNATSADTATAAAQGGHVKLYGGSTAGTRAHSEGGVVQLIGGGAVNSNATSAAKGGDIEIWAGYAPNSANRGSVRLGVNAGNFDIAGSEKIEVMRIVGATRNVGINTTTPNHQLDVAGTFRATELATLSGGATITGATNINTGTSSSPTTIGNGASTTTINAPLQLVGLVSATATPDLLVINGNQVQRITKTNFFDDVTLLGPATGSTASLRFQTAGTEKIRITSGGNVGINTTSPDRTLDVAGTFRASGAATLSGGVAVSNGATVTGGAAISNGLTVSGGATVNGLTTLNNGLEVYNGATIRSGLTLSSLTASGSGGTQRLLIIDGSTGDVTQLTRNDFYRDITFIGGGTDAVPSGALQLRAGGTAAKVQIETNGKVGIGMTNTTTSQLAVAGTVQANGQVLTSDARFKTNVAKLIGAAGTLEQLQGVSYDWNRAAFPEREFNDKRQYGVIAQEVERVLPHLVDTDAQGYKSVNYIGFVPLLIEGVKEQQAQLRQHGQQLDQQRGLLEQHGVQLDAHAERIGIAEQALAALDKRTGKVELRLTGVDERLARLTERTDQLDLLAARFDTSVEDTMAVRSPNFRVSNLTAERARVEELIAKRLEAEEARFKTIEADRGRMNGTLEAETVNARRFATGEREVFVSFGSTVPLFEVPEGAHFTVTLTAGDGSYASATVVRAGGQLRVLPTAAQGIDLVPMGTQVGVVAPSKRVKASWLRTG